MLKQTVKYEDFNGEKQEEVLYFNLTATDIMENLLPLEKRIQAWYDEVKPKDENDKRDLTPEQTRELLYIIKTLIQHSYGIKSEDGKKFRKSEEIFDDFKDSAVYDQLIMDMFLDPENVGLPFITGIFPERLVQEAKKAEVSGETPVTSDDSVADAGEVDNRPAWIRENRDPTRKEMDTMTQPQLAEAFKAKMDRHNATALTKGE